MSSPISCCHHHELRVAHCLHQRKRRMYHWDGEDLDVTFNHLRRHCECKPFHLYTMFLTHNERRCISPFCSLSPYDVSCFLNLPIKFSDTAAELYSYQHNTNISLRKMAFRTFIGTLATLTSSVANLTILMVLKGEPGWICLMCCNADILFSVLVLHWVTQIDNNNNNKSTTTNSVTASRVGHSSTVHTLPPTYEPNSGFKRMPKTGAVVWAGDKTSNVDSKVVGTTTTECYAEPTDDTARDSHEEGVELKGITVRTEQHQEVEIDSMKGFTRSESTERMV
jgi:hypothetical protein